MALVCSGLASGHLTPHAIAHWARLHASELLDALVVKRPKVPSEATIRRVLRLIDPVAMGGLLGNYGQQLACQAEAGIVSTATGARLQAQAVDGKELRGVRAHERPLSLVSLVQHGSGIALAQVEVAEKSNEIPAVPMLLAQRDLTNTVITADALHTQRDLARQIVEQNGHYFMVVKENQIALYQAIELLFSQPPWLPREQASQYQVCQSVSKGHGRREVRTLESSTALSGYLDWPGAQQVMRRHCKRVIVRTGEVSSKTTYAITSLPAAAVGVTQLASLWRSHWTVENRTFYVLDVTMGEDSCQVHTGNAPQALSLLRKAILALFRARGWSNVADAMRHHGASVRRALILIGALPT